MIGPGDLWCNTLIMVQCEKFKNWHNQDSNTVPNSLIMTSHDITHAMTSRAHDDIIMTTSRGFYSDFGCQALAMDLSLKPSSRFRSFLGGTFILQNRHHTAKIINMGLIIKLWENFPISMATNWNFQILFSRGRSLTPRGPPYAILSRSVEKPWKRPRTNKQTDRKLKL